MSVVDPVVVIQTIEPANESFGVVQSKHVLDGCTTVQSLVARNALPLLTVGCLVFVIDNATLYYCTDADAPTFSEVSTGAGLPSVTNNDGYALIEIGGVWASRAIKSSYIVAAFDISAFATSTSTREVGQSAATPAFTASYNRTPTAATLTNNSDAESKNVVGTPTAFASDSTFTKTANNASVTFTLSASEDGEADTATTSIAWRPRVFYGVSAVVIDTEAEIEALASSALQSSRAATISVTPGVGEYIYYVIPSSYGTPTFTVGGFAGGFSLVASAVSVTNAYSVTQNYDVWRSDNANLGATSVVIT